MATRTFRLPGRISRGLLTQDVRKTKASSAGPIVAENEFFPAADAGLGADDGGDAWWSGVQRCFVGVAIAGAAAALGVSNAIAGGFTKNDEIVRLPSLPGEASALPTQRLRHTTTFQRWAAQDELPLSSAPLALEAEGWSPEARPVAPFVRLWGDADELPAPAAIALDADGWRALQWPITTTVAPMVWAVPDELPNVAAAYEDDAAPSLCINPPALQFSGPAWWADVDQVPAAADPPALGATGQAYGQRLRSSTSFQRWPVADELPSAAAPVALDDEGWQPKPSAPARAALLLDQADADFAPPAAAVALDDGHWLLPATQPVAPKVRVWAEDDVPAAPPVTFTPSEDDALALPPQLPTASFIVWATDEEVVPAAAAPAQGGGGAGLPFYGQRASASTKFVRWASADDVPQPAVFYPVEEDGPRLPRNEESAAFVIWATSDEIVPQAPALALADDGWQPPITQAAPAKALTWHDDAPITQPATPLAVQYDEWLPPVFKAPVPAQPWQVDDVIGTPPAALPVEDDAWLPPLYRSSLAAQPLADDGNAGFTAAPAPALDDGAGWQAPRVQQAQALVRVWIEQEEWVVAADVPPDVPGMRGHPINSTLQRSAGNTVRRTPPRAIRRT